MIDWYKGTQVFAVNPTTGRGGEASRSSVGGKFVQYYQELSRVNSTMLKYHQPHESFSENNSTGSNVLSEATAAYGLPKADLIEPRIQHHLKFVDIVSVLADIYSKLEVCSKVERSALYMEQCAVLRGSTDPKLSRRCLRLAREHAVDVHSKVVLSAWLRFERREDELLGVSAMDCGGWTIECPKFSLIPGYNLESANGPCSCPQDMNKVTYKDLEEEEEGRECSTSIGRSSELEEEDDYDMWFCIGEEEVKCNRHKIASLSRPFKSMLYGSFTESRLERIYFAQNGTSAVAMKAAEAFSRTKVVDSFDPHIVLELLVLANKFCCDELKSACDDYLASLVDNMDIAMLLIEYGLEETAYLLVASCLQVIMREIPSSMHNPNVIRFFCNSEVTQRLSQVGHASFLLYSFLSQVAIEEDMESNKAVMLLERMGDCADTCWQKQLAFHQLGCVMLERKEYKDAEKWFGAAAEAGHAYSLVGVARAKYKRGHKYKAYKLMDTLISDSRPPSGWMFQERALYSSGQEKKMDLNTATDIDPTLSYPYMYRAVSMLEEDKLGAAISEINKIIGFKVSPDCLELRSWFSISLEDYEGALRDVRALLTLDPEYMMFHGKLHGLKLVELLCRHLQQLSQADCWMQLYDRWSSVDDVGSLAAVQHMLTNDSGSSHLHFRQSLLLQSLNCHKAAMRSLRMARNHAASEHERLVYEGWILYDTGYREAALSKAEASISSQRSFEAFFLKAYILSETTTDSDTSLYIIQLLEQALRCPSDGLRKGQALSNLASIYIDVDKLDNAIDCYTSALDIKHTRAHQGLARVYYLKNQRKAAYDEMTKFIEKARYNASAYEKRSEYCEGDMAKGDLRMTTRLDPLRAYPYRYRAAALMDEHREAEAIAELTKAISFKLDLRLLHLRATFHDSIGDHTDALKDCAAALSLDPEHGASLELYQNVQERVRNQMKKQI